MSQVLAIISVVEAALQLAVSAGLNIERLRLMRAENVDGKLTEEQIDALAKEAHDAVEGM